MHDNCKEDIDILVGTRLCGCHSIDSVLFRDDF